MVVKVNEKKKTKALLDWGLIDSLLLHHLAMNMALAQQMMKNGQMSGLTPQQQQQQQQVHYLK